MQEKKDNSTLRRKIFNIIGIVLCVILIPVLIINCVLLVKGWVNPDEVPSVFNISPMIVESDSMDREFSKGSMIFIKKVDPSTIKADDIISYFDPTMGEHAVTTHKVWKVDKDENGNLVFLTYGTTQHSVPSEVTETDCEKIAADKLVGIYTGVRFNGLGSFAKWMSTTPGLVVCVFVPLVLLIAYDIIRRKLEEKKHGTDKDQLMKELEELRKLKEAQEKEAAEMNAEAAPAEAAPAEEAPAEEAPAEEKPAEENKEE